MLENIVSFFVGQISALGGKIDAVVGKVSAVVGKVDVIGAEMARLKSQTRRRHGAQYADAKVDAVREAMVRHEESSVARNSENTRRTLCGVFEYSRRLLESAGIATLEQFRKIKHALDVRAYRTRLKELDARETRKEESDSCVEEGVSCDCANEETSAAAPGGSVAPRRNEKGRGAVHQKATFHSPHSHAPDCLISCEYCECPSRGAQANPATEQCEVPNNAGEKPTCREKKKYSIRFAQIVRIIINGLGSSINCLGRRVTSYTTRDAKEIAELLAMVP
jgi:hypothetical protein